MLKLATTSFIIQDTRINNAQFLENQVDEIELLYFESKTNEDRPTPKEINQLSKLNLTYNIHMPIDRDLSNNDAWKDIFDYASSLQILSPTTYTFHPISGKAYIDNICRFAEQFGNVTVENINSDIEIFNIMGNSDISYCFDIGHALLYGVDPYVFIEKWGNQISHIHFHGVKDKQDHHPLSYLDRNLLIDIIQFAHEKNKTLCLEVFNQSYFKESLSILRSICEEKDYTDYWWCR